MLTAAEAWLEPGSAGGALRLDRLKPWCTAGTFLCNGFFLQSHQLLRAAQAGDTHALLQGLSFLLAPLLGLTVAWLTGLAGGNKGLAVVNSVRGNLVGLAASPLLIGPPFGHEGGLPLGPVIGLLAVLVAMPVALGQLARLPGPTLAVDVPNRQRRPAWRSISPWPPPPD